MRVRVYVRARVNSLASAHLPMSMHRSPRMLPGLESAGLVSPSIILPSFTMF